MGGLEKRLRKRWESLLGGVKIDGLVMVGSELVGTVEGVRCGEQVLPLVMVLILPFHRNWQISMHGMLGPMSEWRAVGIGFLRSLVALSLQI